MKTYLIALAIVGLCFTASAQKAVEAFAQKDDTYLLFSDRGFDSEKKYVLFNFWSPTTPDSDVHNTQFQTLKQNFSGEDNIEFVNVEWRTEEDIQAVLEKYRIESKVKFGKHIRLSAEQFSMNTSAANAFFLMEDSRAAFLCSGGMCSRKIKELFNPGRQR